MKKNIMGVFLSSLLLLSACNTNDRVAESDISSNSNQVPTESTSNSGSKKQKDLISYQYSDERPLWILVPEANEILKADGNHETMIVMESIMDNDIRKELQKKYNEGYSLSVEEVDGNITGKIELRKANQEAESLTVELNKINYDEGKKIVGNLSEKEKSELESQFSDTPVLSGEITSYDDAVKKIKEERKIDSEDKNVSFFDYGMQNDGRDYYYVMLRNNETSDEEYLKVYIDNGELSF